MANFDQNKAIKDFQTDLKSEQVQQIYANSFVNFVGTSDVAIHFKKNNNGVAILNLSYTTAKSLAEKLGSAIKAFESETSNVIMTVDHIDATIAVKKNSKQDEK